MTSDSDAIKPGSDENMGTRDEDGLDGQLKRLENDFRDLTEKAQNLLTERVYLENEVGQQKKKVNRLEEEIRMLRSPPHIVGHIQDCIDSEHFQPPDSFFQVLYNMRQREQQQQRQ